eukprot:CAMPEP_0185040764 /NCGR_PEP_ID=MMETSP1103-20130426/39215_1 /TAXON_ID=36769 /ORGANISM="Paraphysomonas bandaiensis, Strain Caron Lab Isolate" /LENGTH=93 /DNA_ID=CAMNT_0027580185 /DNA_START=933 /DNA_END=1214 /DNA_ORIENTATION=+
MKFWSREWDISHPKATGKLSNVTLGPGYVEVVRGRLYSSAVGFYVVVETVMPSCVTGDENPVHTPSVHHECGQMDPLLGNGEEGVLVVPQETA